MHEGTSEGSIIVVSWLVDSSWSRIHKSSKWEQSIPVFQKTKNEHWSCLSSSLSPVFTKHCASNAHERTLGKTQRNTHSFINSNQKNETKKKHGQKPSRKTWHAHFSQKNDVDFKNRSHIAWPGRLEVGPLPPLPRPGNDERGWWG